MADLGNIGTGSANPVYTLLTSSGSTLTGTGGVTGADETVEQTVAYIGSIPTAGVNLLPDDYMEAIGGVFKFMQSPFQNTGVISGTVKRSGVAQSGVYLALINENTGEMIAMTTSDANGEFSFGGLYVGQAIYTIVSWGDDYSLGLTKSNLTPTLSLTLDYIEGGSSRMQTKVLADVNGRVRETTINSYLSYVTTIGDGAASSFLITHNLDSRDLIIQTRRASAPYDIVDCEIEYTSTNTVTLNFAVVPSSNDIRVIVLG